MDPITRATHSSQITSKAGVWPNIVTIAKVTMFTKTRLLAIQTIKYENRNIANSNNAWSNTQTLLNVHTLLENMHCTPNKFVKI